MLHGRFGKCQDTSVNMVIVRRTFLALEGIENSWLAAATSVAAIATATTPSPQQPQKRPRTWATTLLPPPPLPAPPAPPRHKMQRRPLYACLAADRTPQSQPCAATNDGVAFRVAERCKHATYPEPSAGGLSNWLFWARRWLAAGTTEPCACCATSSGSAQSEPRQPCAAPNVRLGVTPHARSLVLGRAQLASGACSEQDQLLHLTDAERPSPVPLRQ